MAKINDVSYVETKSKWTIKIEDLLVTGRNKDNYLKLNRKSNLTVCQFSGCTASFLRTRQSGLCDNHAKHQHDLYLTLFDSHSIPVTSPRHDVIINHLIEWAKSRNFDLLPFFKDCSFTILGNIPDVSTLSGDIVHNNFTPKSLDDYFDICVECVDRHFPEDNNSSYQYITIKGNNFHARLLALTFVGLLLCEEANRGDRWFWREIAQDEKKTNYLGAAMPLAYFASMNFPWGMEIGKAAPKFIPSGK